MVAVTLLVPAAVASASRSAAPPPAPLHHPGVLVSQAYSTQISIMAIATRAYLMRETIRALRADSAAARSKSAPFDA